MLLESIILAIFICSFGGVALILARKIPVLNSLSPNGSTGIGKSRIISSVESKLKNFFRFFEKQIILHRLLSFIKVMTLRIETRVDALLHNIRRKAQQK